MDIFQNSHLAVHHKKHRYLISEVLDSYKRELSSKKQTIKYTSYAKALMMFCIEHNSSLSPIAFNQFLTHRNILSLSLKSIIKHFFKFCIKNQIEHFYHKETFKGEHPFILRYIAQTDFKNANTKTTYLNHINAFFRHLLEGNKGFSYGALKDYLQEGLARKLSVFTLNIKLASIKSFVGWLIDQNDLTSDMNDIQIKDLANILKMKSFKIPKETYHKESLNVVERDELLSRVDELKGKLAISLQVFEGLRAFEVCALELKHIDLENNTILVKGKGRYVADKIRLFENTKEVLLEYLGQNIVGSDGLIFGKMSYHKLYKIVDKAYLKPFAKEKKTKLSLHSLRHSAAQIMVEKGIDKDYIQKQLRHADYQTTQIYMKKQVDKLFLEEIPKRL